MGEGGRSNNTNKHSPQELVRFVTSSITCSNNTNKHSPQERSELHEEFEIVQIIQINIVLKNHLSANRTLR